MPAKPLPTRLIPLPVHADLPPGTILQTRANRYDCYRLPQGAKYGVGSYGPAHYAPAYELGNYQNDHWGHLHQHNHQGTADPHPGWMFRHGYYLLVEEQGDPWA